MGPPHTFLPPPIASQWGETSAKGAGSKEQWGRRGDPSLSFLIGIGGGRKLPIHPPCAPPDSHIAAS